MSVPTFELRKNSNLENWTPQRYALLAAAIAVPVVAWNLHQIKAIGPIPDPVRFTGLTLGLAQHWDMFSPKVTGYDYWLVAPGRLRDNSTVNAMLALGLRPGFRLCHDGADGVFQ